MNRPNDNRVSINVNVIVDGVRMTQPHDHAELLGQAGLRLGMLLIRVPPPSTSTSPHNTPVTQIDGVKYIEANGTSPHPITQTVWGLAYDNTSPAFPFTPPADAVQGTLNGDGTWSFTAADDNLIPGAACDSVDGGPDNSTILIWYQIGLFGLRWAYEEGTFHGYCPGGSGSGSSHAVAAIPAHPRIKERTLNAGFTRGLMRLGSVALHWNGVSWVGHSAVHGGCVLWFQCNDGFCQLQAAGPGTAFVVAGRPNSYKPFHWSATGTAYGALAGDFAVQITW